VHEFISAGVAGFFREDQVFPKRCGYTKGVEVISISEAVAKYRAAVAERDRLGPDVAMIARTDTRAAIGSGLDEVLRRCEALSRRRGRHVDGDGAPEPRGDAARRGRISGC